MDAKLQLAHSINFLNKKAKASHKVTIISSMHSIYFVTTNAIQWKNISSQK